MSENYRNGKKSTNGVRDGKDIDVDFVLERSVEPVSNSRLSTSATGLQDVVNTVLARLGGREVSPQTLMVVVKYAMELVEVTKLKG